MASQTEYGYLPGADELNVSCDGIVIGGFPRGDEMRDVFFLGNLVTDMSQRLLREIVARSLSFDSIRGTNHQKMHFPSLHNCFEWFPI